MGNIADLALYQKNFVIYIRKLFHELILKPKLEVDKMKTSRYNKYRTDVRCRKGRYS